MQNLRERGHEGNIAGVNRASDAAQPNGAAATLQKSDWGDVALISSLIVALSAGIQATLSALILFGRVPRSIPPGALTLHGAQLYLPEREIPIYVFGCALTLLLAAVLVWYARCKNAGGTALFLRQGLTAIAATFVYLSLMSAAGIVILHDESSVPKGAVPPLRPMLCVLFLPALAAIMSAIANIRACRFKPDLETAKRRHPPLTSELHSPPRTILFDALMLLGMVLAIYIPDYHVLAGLAFQSDEFHHWNYFLMRPLLAFLGGKSLGYEVYAQYGVGWPLLFSAASRVFTVSYGHALLVALVYECIYYGALYALLRKLVRRAEWAAAGIALALGLQLFLGNVPGTVIWQYPSSTILRAPTDIWLMLALLSYARSGRKAWAFFAGVAAGLAVLFETDTGIFLATAFAVFWLALAWPPFRFRVFPGARFPAAPCTISAAAAILTAFAGLYIASRGMVFHGAFWSRWIDGIREFSSGFGFLPVSSAISATYDMLFFMAMMGGYLFVISRWLLQGKESVLHRDDLILACIGVYACGTLTLFVGRSHPLNLYHVAIPFALLCAVCASRLYDLKVNHSHASPRLKRIFPAIMLVLTVVSVIWFSDFRTYPNVLNYVRSRPAVKRALKATICVCELPPDICGVPDNKKVGIERLRRVSAKAASLSTGGKSVAVFDPNDILICLMGGISPWGRYDPLYLFTKSQVNEMSDELASSPPDYIIIDNQPENYHEYKGDDSWRVYHDIAAQRYEKIEDDGTFEFWKRKL